jgi:hypothetical protein
VRKGGVREGDEYFFEILFRELAGHCAVGLITGLLESAGEPFKTFVEAITGGGTSRLDILGLSVGRYERGEVVMYVPKRVV